MNSRHWQLLVCACLDLYQDIYKSFVNHFRCSPRAPSSVRPALMAQDPARVKKDKARVNSGRWHGGGPIHQGGQMYADHMTDDLPHTYDEFGHGPYSPAESPSPSESSSIFTSSDTGSHSTDSSESTRNSTSEDMERLIFGDQVSYFDGSMFGHGENDRMTYSRSKSSLGTSSSGQEVDQYRPDEHRLQGAREGWNQGDESSSLYTNQSKHQFSSKLTEQYRRRLDGTEHDPGEANSVLLRRSARERTAQTFY